MTSTAAAIPVLFDSTATSTNVITFAFEIIRMTGSAVGCVLWPVIHKRNDYAIAVTATTTWGSSVVARVFSSRVVAEDAWCPAVC